MSPDVDRPLWPVIRITVARTGAILARRASLAWTPRERMTGLLGRSSLPETEAMVFPNCRSIHTIGMRFAIDVALIDRGWRIVALKPGVTPGRLLWPVRGAWGVIEMAGGALRRFDLRTGDQLEVAQAERLEGLPLERP